jgi:hypothetical protein
VLILRSPSGVLWKQKLVSNVTNGKIAIEALGKKTDNWAGQTIEVWAPPTQFGAKTVMGIEIAALNGRSAAQPALGGHSRAASTAAAGADHTSATS